MALKNEKEILEFCTGTFRGPTEIGLHLGKDYAQASSSVMHSLKVLVSGGKLVKENRKYKTA